MDADCDGAGSTSVGASCETVRSTGPEGGMVMTWSLIRGGWAMASIASPSWLSTITM